MCENSSVLMEASSIFNLPALMAELRQNIWDTKITTGSSHRRLLMSVYCKVLSVVYGKNLSNWYDKTKKENWLIYTAKKQKKLPYFHDAKKNQLGGASKQQWKVCIIKKNSTICATHYYDFEMQTILYSQL